MRYSRLGVELQLVTCNECNGGGCYDCDHSGTGFKEVEQEETEDA